MLKLYSEKNPNVEIVPEFTNFGAFTDKIATETAGGNAPDMFSVNVDLLAEYARRGVTTPLDQYVPDSDQPVRLPAERRQGGEVRRQAVRDPERRDRARAIFTNHDVLREGRHQDPAGDVDLGGAGGNRRRRSARRSARASGASRMRAATTFPCDIFLRGRGKSMFTPDHKLGFAPEDMEAWYAYWQMMRETGATPPGDVQALVDDDDPSTAGIVAGRTAMTITLTDSFVGFQALSQDNFVLHMMPNGFKGGEMKQRHYCYAGNSTTVSAKSPNQKQVIDIIRFMHFDPEGREDLLHEQRHDPVLEGWPRRPCRDGHRTPTARSSPISTCCRRTRRRRAIRASPACRAC